MRQAETAQQKAIEARLRQWAEERGYDLAGFAEGSVAGTEAASRMEARGVSVVGVVDPDTLETPRPTCPAAPPAASHEAQARQQRAFSAGFCRTMDLAVLTAPRTPPELLMLELLAEADGLCLFNAFCAANGGCPRALRMEIVGLLVAEWCEECSGGLAQRGHAGRTVGQALAAEHGRAFACAEDYREYMSTLDGDGAVVWSTEVEAHRLARAVQRVLWVMARTEDGELAHSYLIFPEGAPPVADPMPLVHGAHGRGGSHFGCLLPVDPALAPPSGAAAGPGHTMRLSQAAWAASRRMADGSAIARLAQAGALSVAAAALGSAGRLEGVSRAALRECGALQAEMACAPQALRAAAERLAGAVAGAEEAAELLRRTELLRRALKDVLAGRPAKEACKAAFAAAMLAQEAELAAADAEAAEEAMEEVSAVLLVAEEAEEAQAALDMVGAVAVVEADAAREDTEAMAAAEAVVAVAEAEAKAKPPPPPAPESCRGPAQRGRSARRRAAGRAAASQSASAAAGPQVQGCVPAEPALATDPERTEERRTEEQQRMEEQQRTEQQQQREQQPEGAYGQVRSSCALCFSTPSALLYAYRVCSGHSAPLWYRRFWVRTRPFPQSMLHASSWLLNEAETFFYRVCSQGSCCLIARHTVAVPDMGHAAARQGTARAYPAQAQELGHLSRSVQRGQGMKGGRDQGGSMGI